MSKKRLGISASFETPKYVKVTIGETEVHVYDHHGIIVVEVDDGPEPLRKR